MSKEVFARIFGIGFLAIAIAGFVPPLVEPLHPGHPEVMGEGGQLLGLFPINLVHNIVHGLFGLWGLLASRSATASLYYARGMGIAYFALALAGFVPGLNSLYGLAPLYGNDIWLHALLALIASWFGWVHRSPRHA